MKIPFLSLLLAAMVCLAAVTTSCIYDPQAGEVVVKEKICVNMDEYETDGTIEARAIYDTFRDRLLEKIDDYGATLEDIEDISVVSATYKLIKLWGDDRTFSGDVYVSRADVVDGPAKLVSFTNQSIDELDGKPTNASLDADGVALLNRALDDLLEGDDPQVMIELKNASFSPVPTPLSPLAFKWLGCVEFQAVVDVSSE